MKENTIEIKNIIIINCHNHVFLNDSFQILSKNDSNAIKTENTTYIARYVGC